MEANRTLARHVRHLLNYNNRTIRAASRWSVRQFEAKFLNSCFNAHFKYPVDDFFKERLIQMSLDAFPRKFPLAWAGIAVLTDGSGHKMVFNAAGHDCGEGEAG
jgi:hypothetical protein